MGKRHILAFVNSDYEDTPYDRWLPPSEYVLHILVSREKADGYRHLPEVHVFDNYAHNGLVEVEALRIARRHACGAILARAEVDVLRAARIRDMCGIPGQGWESALAFRDKIAMKRYVATTPLNVPEYRALETAVDLVDFIDRHGYPVVVKPRSASGSVGTHVLHTEAEMEQLLRFEKLHGCEVETFVAGDMYHVDGLLVDSHIPFINVSRYINGCLAWRENQFCGSVVLGNDSPLCRRMIAATEQALAALPDPGCISFHAEFFLTPQDEIVFCEIASRTGGGRINETIAAAFAVNLDEQWVRAQCGLAVHLTAGDEDGHERSAGFVLIPPQRGVLTGLPEDALPDWVTGTKILAKLGTHYQGGEKSGHYVAAYVITGEDEDIAAARVVQMAEWFQERTRWDRTSEAPT
ncbi:ATP-grasp domain-containing protein [Haliangium ochraceum]|uniref:ATP-dependent carboxylate-amine ligase domain protein ATP-grasp n=1 Tax=Haliangium ochraceum (strain DSM 14365 / JCM 11303 / SMP-2) TaxID=502025 RepID=D0LLC7_HALO1|nr:ATP-grasp domain-containing protein [Haliangium ochraceum]ACY18623.1 ATP-dependent carboxylate-amine ligase domain protein ATP-grasp [Haliangium ochraceum DSM 14365]